MEEINIFKCLDFIRDNSERYAIAKADRIYLEEYRKILKSEMMIKAEISGIKAIATQERNAYASEEYKSHLLALAESIKLEETMRWKLVAAQAKIEAWRSLESSRRIEVKTLS